MDYEKERKSVSSQEREMQIYGYKVGKNYMVWQKEASWKKPSTTAERGTISNSRNPQAGELLRGGHLVVNFRDDRGWDHSRLFHW